jgi:hypothetical protein
MPPQPHHASQRALRRGTAFPTHAALRSQLDAGTLPVTVINHRDPGGYPYSVRSPLCPATTIILCANRRDWLLDTTDQPPHVPRPDDTVIAAQTLDPAWQAVLLRALHEAMQGAGAVLPL